MSRHLPQHPNLDYLKKQAKELLRELRLRNAVAKLADAQHALARDYGFESWPKLKAYVESVSATVNPFVGTWTANLSKSRQHPANRFQSAKMQIEVVGDIVTIADVLVSDSGQEERGRNSLLVDGTEHGTEGTNGYALTARWRGTHVLETVATKDGRVVGQGSYEISADGKTLTVTADQQIIVLDRS